MPINLSDPDFEPTDEQLVDLSKRAFADLEERRLAIETSLTERIRAARELRKQR